jgi:hypothetical protein
MKQILLAIFILISLVLTAQNSHKTRRAIVVSANIDSIIVYEKRFSANDSIPPPENISWYEYIKGTKNILVIAGHATAQTREGKIRQADAGTGSLAVELNKLTGVPILYTTYNTPSDPNYYDNNAFKDTLSRLLIELKPVFVIDLHSSHQNRPFDIDYGTMKGKSYLRRKCYLRRLKIAFINEGLLNQSQDFFPAEKNLTITKFVFGKGIPCIQLEINSNYLSPDLGNIYAQKTAQLLQALVRFINETKQ